MSDDNLFLPEYQSDSQTSATNDNQSVIQIETIVENSDCNIMKIEDEVYEISKPKRILIKAKLINGQT